MSSFIDQELLESCLRQAHPGASIAVRDFEDGHFVVEPGTNYSSEILRVRVEYECDGRPLRQSLVFKVPFLSSHFEFLSALNFYDRETYMYGTVLRRIRDRLRCDVVPRHLLTTDTHVLVLEDLCAQGYYLRSGLLDYEHCASTLRALAMFHAASNGLQRQDERLLAPVWQVGLYTPEIARLLMRACIPVLVEVMRKEQISATALANFADYEKRINEVGDIGLLAGRRCHFDVLNHNDLKTNNILFKRDDRGQPASVRMLDFQTCSWNSPVMDLIFFSMVTMDYAVYEERYDQLLGVYLDMLNETLQRVSCSGVAYTRQDYEADMEASKLFQVYTLVWGGFLDLREAIPGFDYHKIIRREEEELEKVRKNEMFQSRFMKWFRNFERRGFFV